MNLIEHLYSRMAEESGEIVQEACKYLQFGNREYEGISNSVRVEQEFLDLVAVHDLIQIFRSGNKQVDTFINFYTMSLEQKRDFWIKQKKVQDYIYKSIGVALICRDLDIKQIVYQLVSKVAEAERIKFYMAKDYHGDPMILRNSVSVLKKAADDMNFFDLNLFDEYLNDDQLDQFTACMENEFARFEGMITVNVQMNPTCYLRVNYKLEPAYLY